MSVHDDDISLRHILDHTREAIRSIEGYTEQSLAEDRMRHLAVTRLLTIVGEAATRLSAERREELSYIPWRQIIGLRNILIHMYHDVDDAALWQILTKDLPKLVQELEKLGLPGEVN
ncbi:MAG: DUF86 domain-containing protein [Planctomycetes bacterium]|nr:DUF86 domain-containing protein [Planctomycetota bacterium]